MILRGRLGDIRVGQPARLLDAVPTLSAFRKTPVAGAVRLTTLGLDGDAQADLRVHGGPDKAVCVYAAAHYADWRREPGLEAMDAGGFGENFTVDGLDERTVAIGDTFRVGDAVVQVSQPRGPCWKLAARWHRADLPKLVVRAGRSGWYFRVLVEGVVRGGDAIVLEDRPHGEWTIAQVNRITYARGPEADRLAGDRARLKSCAPLSDAWRLGMLDDD